MFNTRPGAGYIAVERAGTEFAIARVPLSANGWHDEQPKADAALIAAAPDLLEALKAVEERANSNAEEADPNSDEHSGFVNIRDTARAAIAKAEGRA